MEIAVIIIILFALFVVLYPTKKVEQRSKAERVDKILKYAFEKDRKEVQNEIDTLQKKLDDLNEDNKPIDDKEMLITKEAFEEMFLLLKDTRNMIKNICKKSGFQSYVMENIRSNDDLSSSKKMFECLKFYIIKDVFRCYEHLGHEYYINEGEQKKCFIRLKTPEGQLLFAIVTQMMMFDDNEKLLWEDFKMKVNGKHKLYQLMRDNTIEALNVYANGNMNVTASDGSEDFAFCMILHNYNRNYENNYRKKMLRIATIIANADGKVTDSESQWLDEIKSDSTPEIMANKKNEVKNPEEELNDMIGLGKVKDEINTLRNFVIMRKKREEQGLKSPHISYHCVFTGNPGTGKTTVARLLASIYKELGVLKKGHLVETDRSGLVAEYVGQTAVKTNKIIDSALDGVLFIDEAYTLVNGGTNDYGSEAVATLLKRMEDERDRLVVILAGYNDEIESFINSNPGLRSRFNRYIHFDDYTAEELYKIFCLQVRKSEYSLTEDASLYIKERLAAVVVDKPKDFGNARYVRNLFEKAIEAQANRLALKASWTKEDLTQITKADLQ